MKLDFKLKPMPQNLESHRRYTMAQRVFDVLKQAIIQLQLRPGNLISEAEIAKQLGLSRQPVREAFIKLADVGLVEVRPQRGTFVMYISRKEVENARFIREAIEVAVVKKAAIGASDEDITGLWQLIERQQFDDQNGDPVSFMQHDEEFHLAIATAAGCQHAWRIIENLKAQMDRVRFIALDNATPLKTLIEQHEMVVSAVAERAPELAGEAMRLHLAEIVISLPKIVADNSEIFVD
ncbi:MAG: GntR family transcriptional regulator [Rhizobiales bacterium]|nr:GntR family transcriptional regulator [Hyphomicrobiales bacterium]NRB13752.1 GntR family transcriptional regulator [Hyphomicrobiales bacterium]